MDNRSDNRHFGEKAASMRNDSGLIISNKCAGFSKHLVGRNSCVWVMRQDMCTHTRKTLQAERFKCYCKFCLVGIKKLNILHMFAIFHTLGDTG